MQRPVSALHCTPDLDRDAHDDPHHHGVDDRCHRDVDDHRHNDADCNRHHRDVDCDADDDYSHFNQCYHHSFHQFHLIHLCRPSIHHRS